MTPYHCGASRPPHPLQPPKCEVGTSLFLDHDNPEGASWSALTLTGLGATAA